MSEIKVNSIKGVGASDAAITVNNTDGTCTANITNKPNRNLIINGAMQVAQRGTSNTTNGRGTVDRFANYYNGADEAPTQAQVDVASGTTPYTSGFRKALKITNGNQTSGAGSTDYIWIQYKLEAQDIANSGWNYVSSSSFITLSFWVKSSVAQDFKGYLRTKDGTSQMYPFATGSLTADTWTKITKTIPGNSNLQFDNDVEQGLEINIAPFFGTDLTNNATTEDAWAAYVSANRTKDNTSTFWTTNDATFEVTGLQLEVSDHATDFEHRSFAQELTLCQRYFQKYVHIANTSCIGTGLIWSGTEVRTPFMYLQEMRSAPSFTSSTASTFQASNGDQSRTASALSLSSICKTHAIIIMTTSSGLTQSNPIFMDNANNGGTDSFFALDSEL